MKAEWYFIEGINPEPWTSGTSAVGRKNGGIFVQHFKDEKLNTYQAAIREELERMYRPEDRRADWDDSVRLAFFLWRRTASLREADATNLQKGLEDALQGVLFANDRQVYDVRTEVIEQEGDTDPKILIRVIRGFAPTEFTSLNAWTEMALAGRVPEPEPPRQQRLFDVREVF